ncbi:hypothetical protein GCM10010182_01380 [Actinomadura cremea]|nr:hypothetical protein GCM10010182_01380 [Actinomadura cremea]
MKAIRQHAFGGADVLVHEDIAEPRPGPGQVRIKVAAAGVSRLDLAVRAGVHPWSPALPMVSGREVAGVVEVLGDGVAARWLGRRVVTCLGLGSGGYAELAVREVAAVHEIDPEVSDEAAVAAVVTGRAAVGVLDAARSATEGVRIAQDTGQSHNLAFLWGVLAHLAAIEGDQERCRRLTAEMAARGAAPSHSRASAITALLDLGLGRHEAALETLSTTVAGPNKPGTVHSLPDLVEAAARAGRPELGRDAARRYIDWAEPSGHPWAQAIAARCAALIDGDEATWAHAVQLDARDGGPPFERARTELLHGEWLRRRHRRIDARGRLRSALDGFERLGAQPWAARAAAELRATGESLTVRAEDADPFARLTPQELQVVRLAATGLTNRDIGAQLFLSPRTVGYHLYNAYPKLGVTSRGELSSLLATTTDLLPQGASRRSMSNQVANPRE